MAALFFFQKRQHQNLPRNNNSIYAYALRRISGRESKRMGERQRDCVLLFVGTKNAATTKKSGRYTREVVKVRVEKRKKKRERKSGPRRSSVVGSDGSFTFDYTQN